MMAKEEVFELSLEERWRRDTQRAYSTILKMGDVVKMISEDTVRPLLKGAVDIHVHAAPDPEIDVGWDQFEISKNATDLGMSAVVFKAHTIPTAATAMYVQKMIDEYAAREQKTPVRVCGGVTLNYYQGGLNPTAVEMCADLGGKIVWLPSHDSAHHHRVMGIPGGIELLDENDKLVEPLRQILEIVARRGLILDTCHSGTRERFAIIREARRVGIDKIMITHPNWNVTKATHEQMAEMGRLGAYIGLFMYGDVPNFNNPNCDPMEMFQIIRAVGPEHIVIASDLGTVVNMPPWEGMKLFMRLLLANGTPEKDIRRMSAENGKRLLGLG